MNDTDRVALVDTTRAELRPRIAEARRRFYQIARAADPLARPPGSDWTVQQVVAHVLTVAQRYRDLAVSAQYNRAADPAEVVLINQSELEAVLAPTPEMVDQLQDLESQLDGHFEEIAGEVPVLPFHCGARIDGATAQTNWLGELLLHGKDVAEAVDAPWDLGERDMLLIARGLMQIGPAYVSSEITTATDIAVALHLPGARPYLIHVHDGIAEMRQRRHDDRPDAVLRAPASTATLMLYQRIGAFTAIRRGLRVVGGRRPWRALKLQSCFEPA